MKHISKTSVIKWMVIWMVIYAIKTNCGITYIIFNNIIFNILKWQFLQFLWIIKNILSMIFRVLILFHETTLWKLYYF